MINLKSDVFLTPYVICDNQTSGFITQELKIFISQLLTNIYIHFASHLTDIIRRIVDVD